METLKNKILLLECNVGLLYDRLRWKLFLWKTYVLSVIEDDESYYYVNRFGRCLCSECGRGYWFLNPLSMRL